MTVGGDSDENLGGSPQDSADTTMNLFGGTNKCASTTEVKKGHLSSFQEHFLLLLGFSCCKFLKSNFCNSYVKVAGEMNG